MAKNGRLEKLRARFTEARIRPSSRRGQNFLLDGNQARFIALTAGLEPVDVVLEVGSGTGFLTKELALSGALVLGVELDRALFAMVSADMATQPNVFFINQDILAGKNVISPEVIERLREMLDEQGNRIAQGNAGPDRKTSPVLKCVSNLPYSAGTPFAMNLYSSPLPWHTGVYLLQKEVGDRLAARPGGQHYGALSVSANLASTTTIERVVPPQVFWPRPAVDSAVVKVVFRPLAERAALPWQGLRRITSACFGARRKNLRNALKGTFPKEETDSVLDRLGLDRERRGETLSPEEFSGLARVWEEMSVRTP